MDALKGARNTMMSARFGAAQKGIGLAVVLSLSIFSACGPEVPLADDHLAGQEYGIWNGSIEPDYEFPWVVRHTGIYSCGGVLIDPSWVLTAAHCVDQNSVGKKVRLSRTDPYTGVTYPADRIVSQVHKHGGFQLSPYLRDDIALIKLSSPFAINKYIQTVGLPTSPRPAGTTGTVASVRHDGDLQTGQIAVYRAPLPAYSSGETEFGITTGASNNKLDSGDSGSGLVTVEDGRALVRGIARSSDINFGVASFSDVYAYRSWILSTMNKTTTTLAGNIRVRWSGNTSRGQMSLGCYYPAVSMSGPLNVVGVQVGAYCLFGGTHSVSCSVESNQPRVIKSFKMKTIFATGYSTTTTLPHSSLSAAYSGVTPLRATREFTCEVGWSLPSRVIIPGTLKAK